MGDFRRLTVWRRSVDWAHRVYRATEDFPVRERYGLAAQLRRSAVSVPSNIAEGVARQSRREAQYHLRVAEGSLAEARTQCLIATKLHLIRKVDAVELARRAQEIRAMISSLRKSYDRPAP
jgi:four helix bundle protein